MRSARTMQRSATVCGLGCSFGARKTITGFDLRRTRVLIMATSGGSERSYARRKGSVDPFADLHNPEKMMKILGHTPEEAKSKLTKLSEHLEKMEKELEAAEKKAAGAKNKDATGDEWRNPETGEIGGPKGGIPTSQHQKQQDTPTVDATLNEFYRLLGTTKEKITTPPNLGLGLRRKTRKIKTFPQARTKTTSNLKKTAANNNSTPSSS